MTPSLRLAPILALGAVALAGLAACVQRPPNNTTAEGQAFYACDRPALDQTAEIDGIHAQIVTREVIRRSCLAGGNIPPLPGAKFVEAPVVLPPLPAPTDLPAATPPLPPAVPDSQNYQPPPIIAPPS